MNKEAEEGVLRQNDLHVWCKLLDQVWVTADK